jgi:hypothetical protein
LCQKYEISTGLFWSLDHFGPFRIYHLAWAILAILAPYSAIFDHLGHFFQDWSLIFLKKLKIWHFCVQYTRFSNGLFCSLYQFVPFRTCIPSGLGHFGHFGTILGHFGPFGPFIPMIFILLKCYFEQNLFFWSNFLINLLIDQSINLLMYNPALVGIGRRRP